MRAARPHFDLSSLLTEEKPSLNEGVARLVLNTDGAVVFANAAVEEISGQPLKDKLFFDVASFTGDSEPFRASSLLYASDEGPFASIRSGVHDVHFLRNDLSASLQFDLVQAQDGRKYIVASALADDVDFTRNIEQLIRPQTASTDITPDPQHFFNMSNDLMIVAGADGQFENINDSFSSLLGYTLNDLEDRTFIDLVHPEDRGIARTPIQTLLREVGEESAEVVDFECRMACKDLGYLHIEWKNRKFNGKIYSVGRDITSLKRQQEALDDREQQLLEAEAIGHMGHWQWLLGQEYIRFSDEVYRIFGLDPDQFTPTLDNINAMLHRRDVGRMTQAFQRAIIEQNDHEIDFRITRPDGEIRHVRCQGRCQLDEQGDVTGLYGIMQDVTQSMLHEKALRDAKESAERAYAAKSQFLANMSHELRTPLNAIIGFSEMMQQQLLGPLGNDRYLDYIKGIRESGEHLLDLITDILDMSKIEAGKYELDLEEINAAKVIRLAAHMIEGRAHESEIKLVIGIPDENLQIIADRRALMQITLNLLSNAVKFSHPASQINVEAYTRDANFYLKVKDNGIGIPANKINTITNPFEQAASHYTRNHEGSGLGLAITKELAELHGGSIHIESTLGIGTEVTIRLPLDASKYRELKI